MKITRVQYTVKDEYVETNKKNIEAVMQALKNMNIKDLKYSTCLMEDGKSFMHLAFAETPEANDQLTNLPEFKFFTSELRAKGIIAPPVTEHPTLVAAGYDIF